MRATLATLLVFALCACSTKDRTGRVLSQHELAALDTCNEALLAKFHGTLGNIDSDEAFFSTKPDQIDIVWDANTVAGRGTALCSTSGTGNYIKGWIVDGLQVQP